MVPHSTPLLPRFPGAWALRLPPEAIRAVGREIGSTAWRDRGLTPVPTMPRCRGQMRPGHTACRHLPHLSGRRCTAAASGQARARLPWRGLDLRWERCSRAGPRSAVDAGPWHGPRPCLVEGSGGARPEPPALQDACGHSTAPRPGCGVPVAPRLGRGQAGPGVFLTRVVAPRRTDDLAQVQAVHPT